MVELIPIFDNAKSFYSKAIIIDSSLYSYNTLIINLKDLQKRKDSSLLSAATLRHLKEFLKQNNLKAETKKQIIKDYNFKGA